MTTSTWHPHKYLPMTAEDRDAMLRVIGTDSVDDLLADIPAAVRLGRSLALPSMLGDDDLMRHLRSLADRNGHADRLVCFLGGGAYEHVIPSVVWHLAGRAEFYTA